MPNASELSSKMKMVKEKQARPLNKDETSLINTCAILSAFMYLDVQDEKYNGMTLKDLLSDEDFNKRANKRYLTAIKDAVKNNESLGDITILSQSSVDNLKIPKGAPYSGFGPELVVANAFKLDNGDICVAYRGTGAGKWIDNGQAFGQESTVMQEAAARYFDYVYKEYGTQSDAGFYVTGHSKGGNEAQYVCMAAEHNYEISHCYEFDGQGFSSEAIEKFREINGETLFYDMQADKITAICGTNDFVSPLGISIAKPENTYYIPTVNNTLNIAGNHDILYMFNQGNPDRINFRYDKFGNAISAEQGNLGVLAANLSDNVMRLDAKERGDCGITMMSIIEKTTSIGYGTGDIKGPSFPQQITFAARGIPIINNTVFDMRALETVYGLCTNLINEGRRENKIGKIIGAYGIGALYTASFVVGVPLSKIINGICALTNIAIQGIKAIGNKVKEFLDIIRNIGAGVDKYIDQEYIERTVESHENNTQSRSLRNDWNARIASLKTGIPELAVVIAPSPAEQYLYRQKQIEMGNITHMMIDFADIYSSLNTKYGHVQAGQDLQKKALYIAEHRAAECIKRGKSAMLFLPDMYEPAFRAQVNDDISKALKNVNYKSTAIVLDSNELIQKFSYEEQRISEIAIKLLEKFPPGIVNEKCKYDFVISDGLDKVRSISEPVLEGAKSMANDALNYGPGKDFDNSNSEDHAIDDISGDFEEER